jgi:hypothetical protein
MTRCLRLLPNQRVTPEQVSCDLRAGRDFGGQSPDLVERRVRIGLAVFFPCGADCARRFQSSIVNEPQTYAYAGGDGIQHGVPRAVELQQIALSVKQVEYDQHTARS